MSFSCCAFIISASDDILLARAREIDKNAIALPGGFSRLHWDSWPDWTQSGTTKPLSSKFGEAWFFAAHSTSGIFGYEHGKNGEILRSLAYTGDEGWIRVEGNPEEWEKVLFDDRQKTFTMDMMRDEPDEPRWKKEVEDLNEGRLCPGNMSPRADGTLIFLIAKKLGTELII